MSAPKKSPLRHFRTKRYAAQAVRHVFRRWAAARRKSEFDLDRFCSARFLAAESVGVYSGLFQVGALDQAQYDRASARWERIHRAMITRNPTIKRAVAGEFEEVAA